MLRSISFFAIVILLLLLFIFYPQAEKISAGIALLLFGMVILEEGFKVFSKGSLQKIIKNATNTLSKSIGIGALVTALMQSSSLVSVITISFISAGLITLDAGIGIIFGANIGTTSTAWLVAAFGLKIKISAFALPMLVFGVLFTFQKKKWQRGLGNILLGLGLFFLGIHYMKEGFEVFNQYLDLSKFAISGYKGVFIFAFLGIAITAILQSSSATLALVLTALAANQITYENALALAVGSNIGTTITAIIGSIGANIAGKRLALAHLIFNFVTGIFALIFIFPFARFVDFLSGAIGIVSTDYTLKLAVFHTIFNIFGVLIILPFLGRLTTWLTKYVGSTNDKDIDQPKFLNENAIKVPATMLSAVEKETKHLFENALFEIVTHAINVHRDDVLMSLKPKEIAKKSTREISIDVSESYYNKVKTIYSKIITYSIAAQANLNLSNAQIKKLGEIKTANRKMVEIIKTLLDLRPNISNFLYTENPHLKKEYNKLRKKIIRLWQLIIEVQKSPEQLGAENYQKLQDLKAKAKERNKISSNSIDKLIRNQLISPEEAASLINDYSNVNDIRKKLIEVTEILYLSKDNLLEKNT
ncbi:MAG: sodium:phosphate symporter [Flavobacteriales bacterium]|nr:MAG: sodium:phosphate symporter [Flavobacteriales bacterium]